MEHVLLMEDSSFTTAFNFRTISPHLAAIRTDFLFLLSFPNVAQRLNSAIKMLSSLQSAMTTGAAAVDWSNTFRYAKLAASKISAVKT